jgi:hypothetical protein
MITQFCGLVVLGGALRRMRRKARSGAIRQVVHNLHDGE